uniref:Uncharacterized protein n=1 Tax=Arundo donax TaxID=35708 RepID=A0A0A9EK47_ARUDO
MISDKWKITTPIERVNIKMTCIFLESTGALLSSIIIKGK